MYDKSDVMNYPGFTLFAEHVKPAVAWLDEYEYAFNPFGNGFDRSAGGEGTVFDLTIKGGTFYTIWEDEITEWTMDFKTFSGAVAFAADWLKENG